MIHEAILYDKLDRGAVRCRVCQWECRVADGRLGVCGTRLNDGGVLYSLIYGTASSVAADPIEKKPLFHFHPASRVFSLGSWGCNFHCKHCQNWQISYARPSGTGWEVDGGRLHGGEEISPEQAVALARRGGCQGIAWTYNEPGIWLEYTLESARLAKQVGLYTVYVTNGFMSEAALDEIGPYLDAYRVDVKGFGPRPYRELARVAHPEGILRVAERARKKWGMHVEVVTNVVPTVNDSLEQLAAIAGWVRDALGPETPWHVTRFFPHAEMEHLPPTPLGTIAMAREAGLAAGLQFVYTGNMPGGAGEDTSCPSCGAVAIRRSGFRAEIVGAAPGGVCRSCGADLNLRGI
ncbi:MAG TPA: AmmeMemoRadiSam system radical SAM enzyme [Chloroflexota bacterium]